MKYIFLIFCLLLSFFGLNQSLNFRFDGAVTNVDSGKKEGGVTISIVQGGSTVISTTSSSSGKYVLSGPINYSTPFDVVFNKSGFVSKRVSFNFTGLNEEDTPAGAEFKPVQDLSIDIFGDRPNVDFSFLNTQPVAKFDWDAKKGGANLNSSVVAQMRTKIDKLLIDAEKNAAQSEANYNAAITAADNLVKANDLPGALKKYEEALSIKPTEKYPSDKIVELDALIQKNKEAALVDKQENQEYYNLIQAADNFRNAKDYEKAKAKYTEALAKKDEQYPKDEIKKVDALIKEKASQAEYDAAIELADMMLKQKSYKAARDKYTEASKLKPSEQYPKTKLADMDNMIKQQEDVLNQKKKYDALVAEGDKLFTDEKLEESKLKYKEALAIESASTYVSGRIKLIDETLAKQKSEKEKQGKIMMLLAEAETAFLDKKYDPALKKYQEVIGLDPVNNIAMGRMSEIENLMADQAKNAALEAEFKALVKKGDDAVVLKKLEVAVTNYEQAIALKQDAAVQTKLADVKKQIEDLKNAEQINADFTKLMAEAKTALDGKDYTSALAKYEAAKILKPAEVLPKTKIDEINVLLKKQEDEASKNAKITALLAEGESLMQAQNWEGAKGKFTEVLTAAPTNETAKTKIKEIDAKLLELKTNADKDAKFNDFVSKGDMDATADKAASAITNYKEALKLKQDAGVQQKIDVQQEKLNNQTASAEKKAKYLAAIGEADKLKTEKKFELAKEKYALAKSIDNAENYPSEQIVIIDKILADQLAAKNKEAEILKLMTEGNTLFVAKDFQTAKTKYEQVLAIDNANVPANKKLAEVNDALSKMMDQAAKDKEFEALKKEGLDLFAQNELNPAKTKLNAALQLKDDADVKKKIVEIDAQLKSQADRITKISSLLSEGQKQFDLKSYATAKTAYEQVLVLDTENAEAKSKLGQIAAELVKQQGAEAQKAAFEKLKKEGLDLAKAKEYVAAKSKLNDALAMQDDSGIRQKLLEIDGILAQENEAGQKEEKYKALLVVAEDLASANKLNEAIAKFQEASTIKPTEAKPKQRIVELNELIKAKGQDAELDKKYLAAIKKGDELVDAKNYVAAISAYNEALAMKPTEVLPVDKAKRAQELSDAMGKSENDEQYEKILSTISTKIDSKEFPRAKELITRALTLRPDDNRPKALLDQINQIEKREADYKKLMTQGDKETSAKEYQKAINSFEQAKALMPGNPDPDARIDAVRQLMDAQSQNNDKDALFTNYVAKGDANDLANDFTGALSNYKSALAIKSSDAGVKQKIAAVEKKIKDADADKSKNTELQGKFNALISEADKAFGSEDYKLAIDKYSAALTLIPDNAYATSRLEASRNQLSKKSTDEVDREYKKIIAAADKNFTSADYTKASEYYNRALSFKSDDPYPKKKLAEIDAILNPVVMNSALLLPLGEIYDNSVMDGSTALAQAEQQRKNLKSTAMKTKLDAIGDANVEMSQNKEQENLETANEIYAMYRNVNQATIEGDIGRQETVEAIKASENKRLLIEDENRNYEHSSVVNLQGRLDEVKKVNAASYGESESIYIDNSEIVKKMKNQTADVYIEQSANYYAENIATSGNLDLFSEKYAEQSAQFSSDRTAEGQRLEGVRKNTEDITSGISSANHDKNIATSGNLDLFIDNYSAQSTQLNDERIAEGQKLEGVRNSSEDMTNNLSSINHDKNIGTSGSLDLFIENYAVQATQLNDGRIAEGQKIEGIRGNTEDVTKEISYISHDKNIATSGTLAKYEQEGAAIATENALAPGKNVLLINDAKLEATKLDASNQEVQHNRVIAVDQQLINVRSANAQEDAARAELQKDNALYINQVDKKATIASGAINISDEEQRLSSQNGMDNTKIVLSQKMKEDDDKVKTHSAKMDDIGKSIASNETILGSDQKKKLLESQNVISNTSTEQKEKAIVANSLGSDYPEGVSQEIFQTKDINGILDAIITRRIVVIQGKGDVYVKTQRLESITYAKNGNPTTEHVWQKETQSANLERHY